MSSSFLPFEPTLSLLHRLPTFRNATFNASSVVAPFVPHCFRCALLIRSFVPHLRHWLSLPWWWAILLSFFFSFCAYVFYVARVLLYSLLFCLCIYFLFLCYWCLWWIYVWEQKWISCLGAKMNMMSEMNIMVNKDGYDAWNEYVVILLLRCKDKNVTICVGLPHLECCIDV